jgi:beta-RFAP synthase
MIPGSLWITTPSRLHFGLLAYGPEAPRQFGGVGLAITEPGIDLSARVAPEWSAEGPLAERALRMARQVADRLGRKGVTVPPVEFCIRRAPPEHVGLGTGTQLSLAVTRAVADLADHGVLDAKELADLADRGRRSGVGLHGFLHGGLIVDGGHGGSQGIPPLLGRTDLPVDWSVLVVVPASQPGLHGPRENEAFAHLPPIDPRTTDRLCRLVLLGLLPAVEECDLDAFGTALEEIQASVGEWFAPVQGGPYARPESEALVSALRAQGLRGVGQSSWGPTLYGFSDGSPKRRTEILGSLHDELRPAGGMAFWTQASPTGCLVRR